LYNSAMLNHIRKLNKFSHHGLLSLVACLVLGFLLFAPLKASVQAQDTPAEETGASPFDNLAVALVIDVSGSMSYTDPLRLRETAAGMFIDLLGAEDYLSVITFDHEAELIKPLGPVGSRSDKEALMNRLSPQLDHRGDTDFVEALELARRQFAETDTGEKIPVIFMLTDGEPDPFPGALSDEEFMEGYMEELWELIDELASDELIIYSVAFSDEIDPDVMERIASETLGKAYILDDPTELLFTFYEALEILKDRRGFLDQSVDLEDGDEHTFNFNVDEAVRQANLVLVSSAEPEEADLSISVEAPGGQAPGDIDELLIGGRDNYKLVILSRPNPEHFGQWAVEVSGSGEVRALGNADLYLEALLMEPDPGAQYPVGEPLDIRVELITREKYEDEDFELLVEINAPDETRPLEVVMERDGNSFRGLYDYVHRTGDYELKWQLVLEGRTILSDTAIIRVRDLPGISTDFWPGEEGFRLGQEMIVAASLESQGRRMQEGTHLQVDSFELELIYRDGAVLEKELFDSGSAEHGNSRQGDGIWSNRLAFEREGTGEALMTVRGTYRGEDFVLRRSYGFSVSEPGSVALALGDQYLWAQPGESFEIPLELKSNSAFSQTLRLASTSAQVELLQDRAGLAPGEEKTILLRATVAEDAALGPLADSLEIRLEDELTTLETTRVRYEVDVLSTLQALQVRYGGFLSGAGMAVFGGLLGAVVLFGGGLILNRFYLAPRLKINGQLSYRKEGGNPKPERVREVKLDLGEAKKQRVVIALGSSNPQADFVIDEKSYSYDMVISKNWHENLPKFLRGWKALLTRKLVVETVLKCTPPGVLIADGKVLTKKELQHDDEFESGSFTFHFYARPEKGVQLNGTGKNILDGKS